jgi:RNA-directed DNA polymerase
MPSRKAALLRQQKGKCAWCELQFQEWDVFEVDHIVSTALGGKDVWDNLQLLHRHCHDEKSADDLILIRQQSISRSLKELYKFYSKLNWEWDADIPIILDRKGVRQ